MEQKTRFSSASNRNGFFVTYLHYVGPPPDYSWNYFMDEEKPDDMAYAKAVIDSMFSRYPIDSAGVYAVGFSDGCGMANRLSFETDGLIEATGTVGGMVTFDSEVGTHPVRMIHFHARNDPAVNYSNVHDTNLNYWLEVNDCQRTEVDTILNVKNYLGELWRNSGGDTVMLFYSLPWNAHDWPVNGQNGMELSASEMMWEFFETGYAVPNIEEDPSSVIENVSYETAEVVLFPNPSNQNFDLKLNLQREKEIVLRIYQNAGKLIYLERIKGHPGKQTKHVVLEGIVPGYYQVNLTGNSFVHTEQLLIQ
jgi:hypothetical protein